MYDKTDPRSALASAAATPKVAPPPTAFAGAEYGLFYDTPPRESGPEGDTWYTRGQNAIVAYTRAKPGSRFTRHGQPDEFVILLPDENTPATVEASGQSERSEGFSLLIVPPGDSTITLPEGGRMVRLFSTQSPDLVALCENADSYAEAHPNLPPFEPWPAPNGGFKIRQYSLDVPDQPGRFGRIFRCTTMMVNYLAPQHGPRDTAKLSPHHHDDFEQFSLALEGSFVHHMRWPWTVDMKMWRDDVAPHVNSPSVTVIPPPSIHTSRGMEPGVNQLVDIFSPPRHDFSNTKGWVLNADDYPMP